MSVSRNARIVGINGLLLVVWLLLFDHWAHKEGWDVLGVIGVVGVYPVFLLMNLVVLMHILLAAVYAYGCLGRLMNKDKKEVVWLAVFLLASLKMVLWGILAAGASGF